MKKSVLIYLFLLFKAVFTGCEKKQDVPVED